MHTTNIPEEWFDPSAPMGENKRYRHPGCSETKDRALVITRFDNGWLWKCHRCGNKGVRYLDKLSPGQYIGWQKSLDLKPAITSRRIRLPFDYTTEIPAPGLAWLYKNNVADADISKWKIGYSQRLNRVILPVYLRGELAYWQGRYLGVPDKEKNPKYVNVFMEGRDNIYFWNMQKDCNELCLVEDILSAIRVGYTCSSVALLYAYVPDDLVLKCSDKFKLFIWLDWDKNSRVIDRVKRYRTLGIPVRMIQTRKDPKYYDDDFIYEQVYGG